MLGISHLLISGTATSLFLGTASPTIIAMGAVAGLLPDIAVSSILRKSLKMGDNQQGLTLNALISCYENRGIFKKKQSTWDKEPLTFEDLETELYNRVEDGCKDSEKLLIKLAATLKYGIFSKS